MKIALHNIHLLPNLQFHSYVYDLLIKKRVQVLFFSDPTGFSYIQAFYRYFKYDNFRSKLNKIDWSSFELVFTAKELNCKADVLLNLNLMCFDRLDSEFSNSVKKFDGLKVFHIGDYFGYRPASITNKMLEGVGVNYLLGYSMHDRYCKYFSNYFPEFNNRVWTLPFGYAPRFEVNKPFNLRLNKSIAVGSVNPLRPLNDKLESFIEPANFFPDESWFHIFRRKLILNKGYLINEMDSMLPEFPQIKDFKYDLPSKFNDYKMFVACESIFNFPPAKYYEGIACGSVLFCSDHECNKEIGLIDGYNCVTFRQNDFFDFQDKVKFYQTNPEKLNEISNNGLNFISTNYSHNNVINILIDSISLMYKGGGNLDAIPLKNRI
jgi:glycosyltransferase involved in cell wall biosynthesis